IPIASFIHSNARANVAKVNGNKPPGTKHSTHSPRAFVKQLRKTGVTRSCITSVVRVKTDSLNAFSPRGASTVITHTQTFARPAVAKVINFGWASIDRARITQTQK